MMTSKRKLHVTGEELIRTFSQIDDELKKEGKSMEVTTLGGVSIILQGIRERATLDIDIANVQDAVAFRELCLNRGIPVDIITIASTVDFECAPKVSLFEGEGLRVYSVTMEDLIRLKLERFRKQDPEDIYATIAKMKLPYDSFKSIVQDMLHYFIGNPRELILSALIVVERMYPDDYEDFKKLLS